MENSKIEWTHHTFNPWIGCTKVSDGCKFCYAEHLMDKRLSRVEWGPTGTRSRTSPANWNKPRQWNRRLEGTGRRERVFCASLADVFEDRPELEEWRADLMELIDDTPNLDWLLLTKRPENVLPLAPMRWSECQLPDNVWIGTSVENQEQADKRIPELLRIPAVVRFLSCEPLLDAVDLMPYLYAEFAADDPRHYPHKYGVDWVIVGGESGQQARPMHPDWARSLRDQCHLAGVPFLFKQWGEYVRPSQMTEDEYRAWDVDHGTEHSVSVTQGYYKLGKKRAGRLLDDREWNKFPQPEIV